MATTDPASAFAAPAERAEPAGAETRRDTETKTQPDTELARARFLARVLDDYFVDPLLGFVLPGAGDAIGSMLGFYTVTIAVRRKVSPVIIARMLMNLAVDAAFGFVPVVGDLFDAGFKAKRRNLELLAERVEEHGGRATWRDWLVVIGAGLVYLAVMALILWMALALLRAVF